MLRFTKRPPALRQNKEALDLLAHHERFLHKLAAQRLDTMHKTVDTLPADWERNVERDISYVANLSKGRQALRDAIRQLKYPQPLDALGVLPQTYQISSLFLRDCAHDLTRDPAMNERLHLITGTETSNGTKVLSRIERVELEQQSPAYVKANDADAHLRIVTLSEVHEHTLLGVFHSHMAHGAEATRPSGTDLAFMARLAKIGCYALGGIFSLDGYVRFFLPSKPFTIDIYGTGVEPTHDTPHTKIFRILGPQPASLSAHKGEGPALTAGAQREPEQSDAV